MSERSGERCPKVSGESCPFGVENVPDWWESYNVNATLIRPKWQTTIPSEVCDAAGLRVKDKVEWRFEDGEIRGRKLVTKGRAARFRTKAEFMSALRSSPLKFKRSWEEMRADTREP